MTEPVQAVVRAFDLLAVLRRADRPVALGDLAEAAGLPKSTTRRLLATLELVRAAERGAHGLYTAGPMAVGANSESNLRSVAAAFLRDIVDVTGEDATLAVADRGTVIYLDQVPGPNPIQVPEGVGIRHAPHAVSAGLALMSGWTAAERDAYLDDIGLDPIDAQDLRAKVETATRKGYVWHIDQWVEGVSAVAAPVRAADGRVIAALGAFGASYRFPGDRDPNALGRSLVDIVRSLEALLG